MSGKVAVVTGSNKGIGLSIVRALCKQFDGDVYLLSRDEIRGQTSVEMLKKEGLNPKFHQLDIESLESIKKFKDFLKSTHGGIDILVNNAGISFQPGDPEPIGQQAEVTMKINVFGTSNVCNELFPLLKPNARVVNVSSSAGFLHILQGKEPESGELRRNFADPKLTQDELITLVNTFVEHSKNGTHVEHGWPNAYRVSKIAVSALTRIQQRELDETRPADNILVNSVHPGYVATDMTLTWGTGGYLTPDEGAIAPTWAALFPAGAKSPRGGYVWHDKTIVDWVNGPLPAMSGCCSSTRMQNYIKEFSLPVAHPGDMQCQFRRDLNTKKR